MSEVFEMVNTLYVVICIIMTPCILARRCKFSGAPVADSRSEKMGLSEILLAAKYPISHKTNLLFLMLKVLFTAPSLNRGVLPCCGHWKSRPRFHKLQPDGCLQSRLHGGRCEAVRRLLSGGYIRRGLGQLRTGSHSQNNDHSPQKARSVCYGTYSPRPSYH